MARLAYPEAEELSKKTRDLLSLTVDINIFRMMGHCETLIAPFLALGANILMASRIDPVLRELAIVRAAVHCNSAYELRQHDAIALEVGVSQEKIDALRIPDLSDAFSDSEKAIIRFTDELIHDVKVSDPTFAAVERMLSPCEIQELIIAVGYYSMVGRFLETLGVDLETGTEMKVVQVSEVAKRVPIENG